MQKKFQKRKKNSQKMNKNRQLISGKNCGKLNRKNC